MEYFLHLAIFICFYTLLAQSLNLSAGFPALISLAHAGFYGIGAYTTAILSLNFGFSFWITLPLAMMTGGCIALLVSLIALRTIDDYFIICTLGIQIIIFALFNNLIDVTGGPLGIPAIPEIQLFEFPIIDRFPFLILSFGAVCVVWFLLYNLTSNGFGKILTAIGEDEIYTKSIGKNVYYYKTISFTISSSLAAIPGVFYAHYIAYIDPTVFTIMESIFILSIVIIGGMGSLKGSFIAAFILVLLPEFFRFIGLPDNAAANLREIFYGLVLVILMLLGKNGIFNLLERKEGQRTYK